MRTNSVEYFYTPPEKISEHDVVIDGDEFAHMVHVMRRKAGDVICVVDGRGTAYDVVLENLHKKMAHGRVMGIHREHNEPPASVTLAAGVLKNPSRFDFLVEKATELGVSEIFPLKTERALPNHAKSERWQKLALAAMKQSCRSWLPVVRPLCTLDDMLNVAGSFDVKLIAHEGFDLHAHIQAVSPAAPQRILLLIGPEGGFSDAEVEACLAAGCKPVSLGIRRLRTETAAIAAMTLIGNAFFGPKD